MVTESKTIYGSCLVEGKLAMHEISMDIKLCRYCKIRNHKNGYCDVQKKQVKETDCCRRFKKK